MNYIKTLNLVLNNSTNILTPSATELLNELKKSIELDKIKEKQNPKEIVNILDLVETFITTLNERCIEHKIEKVYSVRIIDTKIVPTTEQFKQGKKPQRAKQLIFTVANTATKERLTLFTQDYVLTNPAKALTTPFKRILYREFLFNAVGTFGMSLESQIRSDNFKKNSTDPNSYLVHQPLTPKEAHEKTTDTKK